MSLSEIPNLSFVSEDQQNFIQSSYQFIEGQASHSADEQQGAPFSNSIYEHEALSPKKSP